MVDEIAMNSAVAVLKGVRVHKSERQYGRCNGRIEALRRAQRESSLQATLFSTWADDYLWYSGQLLSVATDPLSETSDLLPTAFEVTERMRARSLLDQLSTSSAAPDDFAAPGLSSISSLALILHSRTLQQAPQTCVL